MKATLIIYLILSFGFAVAENQSVVASEIGNDEVYTNFWDILDTEAKLIIELNTTDDNETLAHELILNSQNGSKNAVQISALIWQSLDELEKSGIRTYYTTQELKQMAENISQNGLPQETVQTLKEQGWSEEEIKALYEYIAENAAQIDEDFNMTKFLKDFSQAFVEVAFKYNHYEAWALEKWLWSNPQALVISQGRNEILPQIQKEWIDFYKAYYRGSLGEKLSTIRALKQKEYSLITRGETKAEGGVLILTQTYENSESNLQSGDKWKPLPTKPPVNKCKLTISYYWKALKSYELTSQIESILMAQKFGNKNPELNLIMNEKVSELKRALTATKTIKSEEGCPIIEPPKPTPRILRQSDQEALIDTNEGHLIVDVDVIAVDISGTYITYKLKVKLNAEKNAVNDISVNVDGTKLNDSTHYEYVSPSNMEIWTTDISGRVYDDDHDGEVTVSGKVKVVYTPSCGIPPASVPNPMSCSRPREIVKEYSKTIELKKDINPDKVHFYIIPVSPEVNIDDSVTFKIKVVNDNNVQVSGWYSVDIAIPEGHGQIYTKKYTGSVEIPAHASKTITIATINYVEPGTFGYSGSFNFGYYSKDDSGYIIVESDGGGSSGSLSIESVDYSPKLPRDGDLVNFTVKVKSTYSTSQDVKLELFVDGNLVGSVQGVINANSGKTFNLHWFAQEGDHSYTVKVYTLLGGQKFIEDERGGSLNVGTNGDFSGVLSVNVTGDVSTGARMRFVLNVKNVENAPRHSIPVRVYYVYTSPNGKWHDAINVKEAEVNFDPLGKYQDWFDFNFENPGTYDFYLMVNGQEVDEKTIKVNTCGSISAVMTCNPEFVTEDVDSVSCRVDVENLGGTAEDIWITNIHFAGGEIYDKSSADNLVTPSPSSLTLNAYSTGTFTFMIPINDGLQERIPVDLSDINLGTPIAVKAYLNMLKEPVMFVVQMNPREKGVLEEVKDYIVNKVKNDPWGTSNKVAAIIVTGKISVETNPFVLFLTIYGWAVIESMKPLPPDNPGDNNLIVGDES